MFPQAPDVAAGPLWLQLVVAIAFCFATIAAAVIGYRKRVDREPPGAAATVLASIPDMSAIRHLTDVCRLLSVHVESLNATFRDHTHYLRNKIEVDQELCQRMRELKEEIIRSDRQRAGR